MIREYKVKRFITYSLLVVFLFTITACDFRFPKSEKVNNVIGAFGFSNDSSDDSYRIKIVGVNLIVIGLRLGLSNYNGIGFYNTGLHKGWHQPISTPFIFIDILPFWNSGYGLNLVVFGIGI